MKNMDEYVKEQAERFMFRCPGFPMGDTRAPYLLRDLIRQITKECQSKVNATQFLKELIGTGSPYYYEDKLRKLKQMLNEIGVEVEE